MRTLPFAVLFLGLTACGGSSTTTPPTGTEPERTVLAIGDPAPPLRAGTWLNGPEVKGFEPGKVYVVDFWAVWCGPCIQMMPHLAELQHQYREQGLVVIPFTTITANNPMPRVSEFVKRRGPKLGLTFAVAETRDTDRAYMEASGSDGIPTSFVIDKQGKIAYFGHPLMLDDVLPKVLAGTWKGESELEPLNRMRADLEEAFGRADAAPADGPKFVAEFEKKYPEKAKQPMIQASKVVVLIRAKQYDEAKALTEALIPELVESKATGLLNDLRSTWGETEINPERKHLDLSVKAAEAALQVEGAEDPVALLNLADAHHTAGDPAKAAETAERAVKAAGDDAELKKLLEKQLAKYRDAKKAKK